MADEIISRAVAKARGLKTYFTGKPCIRGNVAIRILANGQCMCHTCHAEVLNRKRAAYVNDKPAQNARSKAWKVANRDRVAETWAKYRQENKSSIQANEREWRRKNKARKLEINANWVVRNKSQVVEYKREHREKNIERYKSLSSAWRAANVAIRRAVEHKRRAKKLNATPSWYGEFDEFVMREAADLARIREHATGIKWQVDHMVPLQARTACGLHCASNLQVIPASMNASKRNKMQLTEPGEWLR